MKKIRLMTVALALMLLLLPLLLVSCKEEGIKSPSGFLFDRDTQTLRWGKMGVLAVEMEAAALYMNAARAGKRALAICTISDHLLTGEATTAEQRQTSFTDMMELALEVAISFN